MNYSGGKGQVFKKIINLMPPHDVYIETHLGGGSIMLNKRRAKRNIGVELDRSIFEIWEKNNQMDIELVHGDTVNFLSKYPFTGKELVYCDPPYLRQTRKKSARLYKHEYTAKDHIELLEVIKCLPCKIMISGYESDLYKESLKDWHTHSFRAGCHHGVAIEWLWMNYPPPNELHDYSHLGDNFRERERIKRRTAVWVNKLKSISTLEQKALLSALNAVNRDEPI